MALTASLLRAWPPVASALLIAAAFPPLNLWPLVFVGLVPWIWSLGLPDARGYRSGFVFGLVFFGIQLFWLGSFVAHWTHSSALGAVPWVLGTLLCANYFGLFGWVAVCCYRKKWSWVIPLAWAGLEIFRSYIPGLAFPWGLLALPLSSKPVLIGLAAYGWIFLVSGWCVLPSVALARLLRGDGIRRAIDGFILFGLGLALSVLRYYAPLGPESFRVTLVQPGVDLAFGDPSLRDEALRASVARASVQATRERSQLIVLPEGVAKGGSMLPPQAPFAFDGPIPILFGGQRVSGKRYQTAYAYDGRWSFVDKTRLVIFGEFVPCRGYLPFLDSFNLPGGDLSPADNVGTLDVAGVRVGPSLCFEGIFPDIAFRQARDGAELLTIQSIDDWYVDSIAPEELAMAAPFRAVENNRPVVRVASLGWSTAFDARGLELARLPFGVESSKTVALRLGEGEPFRFAPLFATASLLSLVVVPVATWLRSRAKNSNAV